jgi:hypothetical protein
MNWIGIDAVYLGIEPKVKRDGSALTLLSRFSRDQDSVRTSAPVLDFRQE